jgi:hypothetical protein
MNLEQPQDQETPLLESVTNDSEDPNLTDQRILAHLGVTALKYLKPEQIEGAIRTVKGELLANSAFQSLIVRPWNTLTEADKVELYNQGSLSSALLTKICPLFGGSYDSYVLRFGGDNFAPTIRALMQLGILEAPAQIAGEVLSNDAASDRIQAKLALRIASYLPPMRPYAPAIRVIAELNDMAMEAKQNIANDNLGLAA